MLGVVWVIACFKLVYPLHNDSPFFTGIGIMGGGLCLLAAITGLPQSFKEWAKDANRFDQDWATRPDPDPEGWTHNHNKRP